MTTCCATAARAWTSATATCGCRTARRRIVELLQAYKRVDLGGRWMNNVGGPVADKAAFQSRCKFAIAFENASSPGSGFSSLVSNLPSSVHSYTDTVNRGSAVFYRIEVTR